MINTSRKNKYLWISWQRHRRSQNIAARLQIPLLELVTARTGLKRYCVLMIDTWRSLSQNRPRVLIVQNPSLVLTALALIWKPWFRYKLIIDAHNEAVRPFLYNLYPIRVFACISARLADVVIVSNRALASLVNNYGGKPFILPDPIPDVPEQLPVRDLDDSINITVIATYAADEPITEILQVATEYGNQVHLYLTGDPTKAKTLGIVTLPANTEFTGYLSEGEYWAQLTASDAVIDISAMHDCLVCGAYEAVAVGVPMLLADDSAIRELFSMGAVYTKVDSRSIRNGIEELINSLPKLKNEVKELKLILESSWARQLTDLNTLLNILSSHLPDPAG